MHDFSHQAWGIFNQAIADYHLYDSIHQPLNNPFPGDSLESTLYAKAWIDTVQWHLEDLIREPNIDPAKGIELKRWIDRSNQERTNKVEELDLWFLNQFKNVNLKSDFRLNTETPAWAVDRLSILALKIFHMKAEVDRNDANEEHRANCQIKLNILVQQWKDLSLAIDQLLADLGEGKVRITSYQQMKMYNDENLNPVLYKNNL